MKRFNEKILKVKESLKHVAFESLISGVTGRALWKKLYALPNKSLLKVKQAMENYIHVKETSVLRHGSSYFSKKKLPESTSKEDCSPRRDIKL